jgi:putative phosphoesterase
MNPALRIVVISDIHSNLDAFRKVIASLPQYDSLLFLGDLVGYGPQPNEVVEQLQQLQPARVLMGNHDCAVVTGDTSGFSPYAEIAVQWTRRHINSKNASYLSSLGPSARIELNNTPLALFHGSPRDPLTEYIFPEITRQSASELIRAAGSPVVLLGHTHIPMVYSFEKAILANPGSVGQPRDGDPRASFAILTISESKFSFEIKRVEYDIEAVAERIVQAGLPEFLADRLYTGT